MACSITTQGVSGAEGSVKVRAAMSAYSFGAEIGVRWAE